MARAAVLPRPRLAVEYWLVTYRRNWQGSLLTSFLSPILFLAAMGLGLGSLVDAEVGAGRDLGGLDYLDFLAPGLLAGNAMMLAVNESTYPVLGGFKWYRTYMAMAATPLRSRDILLGHFTYMAFRAGAGQLRFPGGDGRVRGGVVATGRAGPGVRHPVRHGLRHAHHRLRRHSYQRRQLQHVYPIRDHAYVLVLGHLLPGFAGCRSSSSRSPGLPRYGMA